MVHKSAVAREMPGRAEVVREGSDFDSTSTDFLRGKPFLDSIDHATESTDSLGTSIAQE